MSRFAALAILGMIGVLGPVAATSAQGSDAPPVISDVHERMARFVDDREVAGAVTLVAEGDRVVHLDAVGKADIEADRPMRPDSICWIASMTKPITAAAVLMLRDEGKLSIEDPVSKHLSEFVDLKGPDGKPAVITIRQLLTHTSGLAEIGPDQAARLQTLAGLIPLYVEKPLQFEPGSKWRYCQSGINTAARVVEVVAGQFFPEFLKARLFVPLGMKDTAFFLSQEQLPRLAKSYRRTDKGTLEEAANPILYGKSPISRDRFPAANGGLYSTATDYLRFCRMLLDGGESGGERFLKPESVRLMSTIQTGDLVTGFTPGNGWGIGCCVVREPQGITAMLSPGTFGHGGAFGTQAWIDPKAKRIYILMVQRANFPNSDASPVRLAFQEAAAHALEPPTATGRAGGDGPGESKKLVLFDGKGLDGWKPVDFLRTGEVKVEDGAIIMEAGRPMTGFTTTRKDLPTTDYELGYEAKRLSGSDFFAAATFPVGKSFLTFVNGGWGGSLTGLSSLDGADASENETGRSFTYKNGDWYQFRVRVTDAMVRCWIGDEEVVSVNHERRHLGTRIEVRRNQPLGFATYETRGAVRDITIRRLTPEEVKATNADAEK